jgi:hypothetical protein
MSERSQIFEHTPQATNEDDLVPVRPAELIREADLDQVSGGGGAAGGVIARQHA